MALKYGFAESEWEAGKEEMLRILQRVASARGGVISYGDLSSKLTSIRIGPHDSAMAAMLGEISEQEDASGRGMLSAIVVHKDGDMEPGAGFFKYAAELGRDVSNREQMWIAELNKVYDAWSKPRGTSSGLN